MRPRPTPGNIRPKVSTMPRQKTEAAAYLNIYKLTVEKKRLQQELETLEERRDRIQKRLALLDSQVAELEQSAQQLRDTEGTATPGPSTPRNAALPYGEVQSSSDFRTVFLEY